ncbi:integral membrane protein [Companilactobacillus mindensis DSM 14500]|uniref:Integral membrane protein n=1 Tax=Companilactobacillus mindensis DSM 14500 TaxID=1423770 RepID=A0A0R1QWK7_9LACO|nr:YibE/F family protein [Companilactobacillus mindensis]KRL45619.1 integral membrane protein [Companilactobacillus mindensis DSM 14500]GEO79786.1 membrane protein [Companilactobacillus mindensis]
MKKNIRLLLIVGLIVAFVTGLTYFDSFMYHDPVVKVQKVTTLDKSTSTDEYKNTDTQITQRVSGKLLNTKNKGQTISFKNSYYRSQLIDTKYSVGQQVILVKSGKSYTPKNVKRDTSLVFTIGIVIFLLYCMKFDRRKLFISVLINIAIYYGYLRTIIKTHNSVLLPLTVITALIISAVALLVILGPTYPALMAYSSTVISTTAALLLSTFVLGLSGYSSIHLELNDFELQPYLGVFLSQVIFSVLGVILDETMDISSSLIEMKKEVSDVAEKTLFKSGINIGKELIGPLINILLFIVIAENLNVVLLYMTNGNSIGYTMNMTLSLGITQLLISAIGIVLTVPITSFIASKVITRRMK